jgi:hypothetical protein
MNSSQTAVESTRTLALVHSKPHGATQTAPCMHAADVGVVVAALGASGGPRARDRSAVGRIDPGPVHRRVQAFPARDPPAGLSRSGLPGARRHDAVQARRLLQWRGGGRFLPRAPSDAAAASFAENSVAPFVSHRAARLLEEYTPVASRGGLVLLQRRGDYEDDVDARRRRPPPPAPA